MLDLKSALRQAAKSPIHFAVAALTLALGIGVNTASFSTADALLYHPIDVPNIERLMAIETSRKDYPNFRDDMTPADYLDVRKQATLVEGLAAAEPWNTTITGTGDPERVYVYRVSAEFFHTVGLQAELGRLITAGEDEAGRDDVAVLSHEFWLRRFGGDEKAIGNSLELDGRKYRIVGVMAKGMRVPRGAELWVPLVMSPERKAVRTALDLIVLSRLKAGVSETQAAQEIRAISDHLQRDYPDTNKKRVVRLLKYREVISGDLTAEYTRLLQYAMIFVLLIACVNVANLLYTKITHREREFAVRAAIGATRQRIVQQLLSENAILGIAAAVASAVLAAWTLDLMRGSMPAEVERWLPGWQKIRLNEKVFTFNLLLGILSAMAAGVVPALIASRVNLNEHLRSGGRGMTSGIKRNRLRSVMVVTQIVLALVLLVGAGLMVTGFRKLGSPWPSDFSRHTLTFRVSLPTEKFATLQQCANYSERVLEKLRAIPGVTSVGLITGLPYSDFANSTNVEIEGEAIRAGSDVPSSQRQVVSAGVLPMIQMPILRGRDLEEQDGPESRTVAVVNEAFVRRFFGQQEAIGKRFRSGPKGRWFTVVGVSKDFLHHFIDKATRAAYFVSYRQVEQRSVQFLLRTSGDGTNVMAAARSAALAVDRDRPVFDMYTVEKMVGFTLNGLQYVAWCLGVSGIISLLMAIVGIYGVMSSTVSEQTHEIGLRVAMGAEQHQVLWSVMRKGLVLTGIGMTLGTVLGFGMARMISGLIFGVNTNDWSSYSLVLGLVLATSMAACLIPARRAMQVDPMEALRQD